MVDEQKRLNDAILSQAIREVNSNAADTIPSEVLALLDHEQQRRKPIENYRELQEEVLKALLFSLAFQSESFRGATAEELETIKQRAIEKLQTDPMFRYFVTSQLAAIMLVIERYKPR
ncbi:MAG: hypothetical protein QOH63_1999 [Acidobacteriota bacterium]|nr:hypothetical protein [Acidobacteriota bacterium]